MEWVEKASFAQLNKLFEISASERDHQVLLSDKNLQVLVKEAKPFILSILPRLAHRFLVSNEHYALKDLPFYEVAHLADSKTRQARLKQRKKKRQNGTFKQAPTTNDLTSNSTVRSPARKKK